MSRNARGLSGFRSQHTIISLGTSRAFKSEILAGKFRIFLCQVNPSKDSKFEASSGSELKPSESRNDKLDAYSLRMSVTGIAVCCTRLFVHWDR
jgi:hypothetical protein